MREQSARDNQSFSPSAGKPILVARAFNRLYPDQLEWKAFHPLTWRTIALAHNPDYVRAVLECQIENGFGNQLESVAASLPYTTGSFAYAAVHAMRALDPLPCVSLTSGFHHASYAHGGGYCTFNGLMIAAIVLERLKLLKKSGVGIIDLDKHYGNGTDDIRNQLGISYVTHIGTREIGSLFTLPPGSSDSVLHAKKEGIFKELAALRDCDILFYQAGADIHVDDPLGGLLSTDEMKFRDRTVFEFARSAGIPIVWNLAGGYQEPVELVVQLHCNTLRECIEVHKQELA